MDTKTENRPLRTSDMVEATRGDGPDQTSEAREQQRKEEERQHDPDRDAARGGGAPLFKEDDARHLRERWDSIQAGFVDEPRRSVEQADQLVAQTIKQLAEMFAGERQKLEHQWASGDDVSTEDLRITLQRYRSFFDRLLSM